MFGEAFTVTAADHPPVTRAQLLNATVLWHETREVTDDNEDTYFAWMEFIDKHGGEVLALAIAAVGRLGPKETRGPYGQRMLGQTQQKIIDAVADRGPLTVSEIAAVLGLNYQNTRRMLPVLEARGMLAKSHCSIKAAQVWSTPKADLAPFAEPPVATEPTTSGVAAEPAPSPAQEQRRPPKLSSPEARLNMTPEQRAQEHVENMRYIHGWDADESQPSEAKRQTGRPATHDPQRPA